MMTIFSIVTIALLLLAVLRLTKLKVEYSTLVMQ